MHKIEFDNLTSLVIDTRNGVDGAFEKLYKETVKFSYGVACTILRNEEDIEDALQNSYMYVAKSIGDLKNPESFESWLATIVRHECQKHIAKRKKISDIFASVFSSKEIELISPGSIPSDLIEKREVNEAVRRIVDKLPDDKRACVVLYYFERNTLPEIAEIFGIPEGTVKSRLYIARKILEKEFKKLQKKDDALYGVSVIPLVAAFFAYQLKTVSVPASIAEGASAVIAAGGTAAVAASSASAVTGGTAATGVAGASGAAGAAGTAGATVTAKVAAVAVAAAVATGGGVATVNYVENKKQAESTTFPSTSITEEYTTAAAFTEETTLLPTETSTAEEKTEAIRKTTTAVHTTKAVTTAASTAVTEKTTTETTAKKETTTKPTTNKETTLTTTQKPVTTEAPTTDAADIYNVSGGILSEYTGEGGNVSIPSSVGGDTVAAIGAGAFAGNTDITSVSLPSTVTKIGQEAFSDCTELESVFLPSSLQSIGIGAFYGCTSLTGINIPTGVSTIGDDAFADCASLKSITIPSGVTAIGDNAFGGCDNLTIRCSEGSAAHNYAVENSIDYELI